MPEPFVVRPPVDDDFAAWQELYAGYADFYRTPLAADTAERLWHWLIDPQHVVEGLVCHAAHEQRPVGLLHFRACPHPLSASVIGFVDDMYIDTPHRGAGVADALVTALAQQAERRGWARLRWVTQADNGRGRALYDRYTGGPSEFIMYDWRQP